MAYIIDFGVHKNNFNKVWNLSCSIRRQDSTQCVAAYQSKGCKTKKEAALAGVADVKHMLTTYASVATAAANYNDVSATIDKIETTV